MVNILDNKLICIEPMHEECYMKDQCLKHSICPMVLVQNLLSGKWKILILWYLSSKTLRFSDIKETTSSNSKNANFAIKESRKRQTYI